MKIRLKPNSRGKTKDGLFLELCTEEVVVDVPEEQIIREENQDEKPKINAKEKLFINEIVFKKLIAHKGIRAIRMARDLGWSHTKLNWFVKGYYAPSPEDRKKIINYLEVREESELFRWGRIKSIKTPILKDGARKEQE